MFQLFVSKLPKSVPAGEVEEFLRELFPAATHIQLLRGSHSGEHKGHAYAHFANEAAVTDALRRVEDTTPPTLHGAPIHVKRASRVDAVKSSLLAPQPLPPQLAHYSYSTCACVPSSLVETLDGVGARCELPNGVTAVAFGTEEQMATAVTSCRGDAAKCLPPLLPELLSRGAARKRGRAGDADSSSSCPPHHSPHSHGDVKEEGTAAGADVVASYERRGFVPLTPAAALTLVRDFMEGRGRIAVKDRRGNVAVMCLPAHAAALE